MRQAEMSSARRFYWCVRRELWETPSIYWAPLIVAVVALIGFGIALPTLPDTMRGASALSPSELREAIQVPYVLAAVALMAIYLLIAAFFCIEALYGERRDRSILFWKSLPVSDRTTVLAKAAIPILVLPLVTFAATVVTQGIMLLASSAVLAGSGIGTADLRSHLPFLEMWRINFGHLLVFHGIWYAPLYGWLLLVSAWAPRLPLLWAILPPVAVGLVERLAFGTSYLATGIGTHLSGESLPSLDLSNPAGGMTMDMLAPHPLVHYVVTPALWGGLALTAVFLLGAARLRRGAGAL